MKKSFLLKSATLLIALPLVVFSCKSDKVAGDFTRRPVDPQLAKAVPFRDFDINAEAGDTIRLAEGTNIYIPSGTFVNEKGAVVNGKVQLHYRAFYSAGEIIASGITMRYDTAGTAHVFGSAGMFEITGTQNGNPVSIAPEKTISMDFASTKNDAAYSFYRLDTVGGKWDFLSTTKVDSNALHVELQNEIVALNSEKPVEPKSFDTKKPVIDIDVDLDNHPELSCYNGIVWQYAGAGNDPEKNQWIYAANWNSAKVEMSDNASATYLLKLSGPEKNFTTKIIPTFKKSDLGRAMAQFKIRMEKFRASQKIREEKEKQIETVPQYERPVAISRLGIHNCDMFYAVGQVASANTEFHFEDPAFEKNKENVTVYVISAHGRVSVGYNALNMQSMFYLSNGDNCCIAVLRGTKKACVLSNLGFSNTMRSNKSGVINFKLQPSTQEVANADDVNKLLRTL